MAEKSKDRVPALTLFFTVLLLGIVSTTLYHNTRGHDFGGRPRYREVFEYRVVSPSDPDFEREMNRYGAEGWDVVTARRKGNAYEAILRRTRFAPGN